MAVSWQAIKTPATAPDEADDSDELARDGPEPRPGPSPENAETWPAIPRAFADGDARRALLRDLVFRALI